MPTYAKQASAVKREAPHRLTPAALRAVEETLNKTVTPIGWSLADRETRAAISDIRFALFMLRVEHTEPGAGSFRDWRDVAKFCHYFHVYRLSAHEADFVLSIFALTERGLSPPFEQQQSLCDIRDRVRALEQQAWLNEIRRLLGKR
jgi:hypothetical protein